MFREAEIFPTLYLQADVAAVGLITTILAAWRLRWCGFIPCLTACIGDLIYTMDVHLWQPPSDTSLAGIVTVLTGANSGLGKATSLALVSMGSHVVVMCHSLHRCEKAIKEANAAGKTSGGSARAAVLNLGSLESAYNLTTQLTAEYPTIHYLSNNAGSTPNNVLTQDGLEKMVLVACISRRWLLRSDLYPRCGMPERKRNLPHALS
jgi:hypothetical protein